MTIDIDFNVGTSFFKSWRLMNLFICVHRQLKKKRLMNLFICVHRQFKKKRTKY